MYPREVGEYPINRHLVGFGPGIRPMLDIYKSSTCKCLKWTNEKGKNFRHVCRKFNMGEVRSRIFEDIHKN